MLRSSGDLLADKRFGYAEALMREGDAVAAANLYAQVVEAAPHWAPAHLALALALEKSGALAEAADAFREAERLDPDDHLGARLHRQRLNGDRATSLPPAYVATLFDQYAPRFDAHLTDTLAYRGPAVILAALAAAAPGRVFLTALDLGCGTGLMARALGATVAAIDGIDLSPAMVKEAQGTGLYRRLVIGDCTARLPDELADSYDLCVAADVLVYLGDLAPLCAAVARVLASGGVFAATAEASPSDPFALGETLRFRHSAGYLRATLTHAGFAVPLLQPCATRTEGGRDVPGLVFVAVAP